MDKLVQRLETNPLCQELVCCHVQLVEMDLVDIMHRKKISEGWHQIYVICSHLIFVSHCRTIQVCHLILHNFYIYNSFAVVVRAFGKVSSFIGWRNGPALPLSKLH